MKTNVNIFDGTNNYIEMLAKIGAFNFFASAILIHILRTQIPQLDTFLTVNTNARVLDIDLALGTFLPAMLIALLARIFKLHNLISALLRIRIHFDVHNILLPLAVTCGVALTTRQIEQLFVHRTELMNSVFYEYASSSPGKAKIDPIHISLALDQWSWFWIILETTTLCLVGATLLFVTNMLGVTQSDWAFILMFITLIGIALFHLTYRKCARYALIEVSKIVEKPEYVADIQKAFTDALSS